MVIPPPSMNAMLTTSQLHVTGCQYSPKTFVTGMGKSHGYVSAHSTRSGVFFPVRGIAIDIDVHVIEKNHFQNLARTFVTPLGDFHMFFLRDGPGRGHCLYKQRNTPKQTRLRKALLHYFSRSLRHKGQQGSAIVSALKIGFASRPIFSKIMLSSGQKNGSLP